MDKRKILEVLNHVYDPDCIDLSIVDMGLITEDDITIRDNGIEVAYRLAATMCPFSVIGPVIKYALEKKTGVPVAVRVKAGDYQEKIITDLLLNSSMSEELLRILDEMGILKRCVRTYCGDRKSLIGTKVN